MCRPRRHGESSVQVWPFQVTEFGLCVRGEVLREFRNDLQVFTSNFNEATEIGDQHDGQLRPFCRYAVTRRLKKAAPRRLWS